MKKFFEEISQALFFKNAIFGLLFILIAVTANYHLFLCGFFAALIGYIYSLSTRTPKILKDNGIMTINGFFFGIAMASIFASTPQLYVCLIIGALTVPFATKMAYEILQHWKLSPLIISYISVVWVFVLSANAMAFAILPEADLLNQSMLFASNLPADDVALNLLQSVFTSMGRIFFLPSPLFGFALLVLVTAFSPRQGLFFFVGTAVAVGVAFLLNAHFYNDNGLSLYSYSAGLVSLGLASFPEKIKIQTILLFCVLSMFLTLALSQLLIQLGLPVLSLPYVITMWMAILSRVPKLNVNWAR